MQERRSEVRMMCADMVEVSWKNQAGKTVRALALLEDISPSGACLQLELPVPVGVEIRWDSDGHRFTGHVRHCLYREIGYFAGIELQNGSEWSKTSYQPKHLLDLRDLEAHLAK